MANRNVLISDVTLNWAKLDTPVQTPFGQTQWELQIATTDSSKADEMKAAGLKVKEDDGVFSAQLKRRSVKADGSANDPVRVVDANKAPMENRRGIGNGSTGNVIMYVMDYEFAGRKGETQILTALQVTNLVAYEGGAASVDFDVVSSDGEASPF